MLNLSLGELLMSLVGYPGETAIAPQRLSGANIARQVALISLKEPTLASYLHHYFSSPFGKYHLLFSLVGSAQQVINLVELRKVCIPLAPKKERDKIQP